MSNGTNYPATGTNGGAVSPNSPATLIAAGGAAGTNAQALLKARANLRWARIIEELSVHTQANILNIDVTGETDVADQPTAIGFTVYYEQDEYNRVEDLDTPGTFITGANAIDQMVAVGIATDTSRNMDVHQPNVGGTASTYTSVSITAVQTRLQTEGDITVETSSTGGSGIEETSQL